MATFATCIQKRRKDGFWPVYIRVTNNRDNAYYRTDKMVTDDDLSRSREITNPYVLQYCTRIIIEWNDMLNRIDTRTWSAKQVLEYLLSGNTDICFSDYAREFVGEMINNGQERSAKNYQLALQHMERFAGTTRVMFSSLTSGFVEQWIRSLASTHRAKEMYPVCLRQVFRSAVAKYNDHDLGIIRIKTNPWLKVKIPQSDKTEKLAIGRDAVLEFFGASLPPSKLSLSLAEMGRDVAMMVLCLGGINTVDLYHLRKEDCRDGIIRYKRSKTRKFRRDDAYMEMRVPDIVGGLLEKYATEEGDEFLLDFHLRYCDSDSFNANVNSGIKQVCRSLGMPREKYYSAYTFRHTWATVAQNNCGASIDEVGFGLNHSRGRSVTRGYIKIDFRPAWELNGKVVDYLFHGAPEEAGETRDEGLFRLSPRSLVCARAVYKGQTLVEFTDIGFGAVAEVVSRLVSGLPDTIPNRAMVQFEVRNADKDTTLTFEKMKGKGF